MLMRRCASGSVALSLVVSVLAGAAPASGQTPSAAAATAAVLVTHGATHCLPIGCTAMDASATPLTRIVIALIVAVTKQTMKTSMTACRPCCDGCVDFAVPYATAAVP